MRGIRFILPYLTSNNHDSMKHLFLNFWSFFLFLSRKILVHAMKSSNHTVMMSVFCCCLFVLFAYFHFEYFYPLNNMFP